MPRYKELDTPKVERIRFIKRMMATGKWVRGITSEELATEWKCSVATVSTDAAEASRSLIRDTEEDPGEIRAMLLTLFATIIKDCEIIAEEARENPFDLHARVSAIRAKTEAVTAFCRAYTTMPKAQEQQVVPVAIEQLTTLLKAHGFSVSKDPEKAEKDTDGTDA